MVRRQTIPNNYLPCTFVFVRLFDQGYDNKKQSMNIIKCSFILLYVFWKSVWRFSWLLRSDPPTLVPIIFWM
jgi:hypothetical protein